MVVPEVVTAPSFSGPSPGVVLCGGDDSEGVGPGGDPAVLGDVLRAAQIATARAAVATATTTRCNRTLETAAVMFWMVERLPVRI